MDLENREAFAEVRGRIDQVSGRIDALEASMHAEFNSVRESLAEGRRHADVRFESLHDDIQMIAAGFASVSAKLDDRP